MTSHDNPFYTDFAEYMRRFYPGLKVQKLSVNTGRGCPNRDGTLGRGGCIYCDNRSFTPSYCFDGDGVAAQLEAGKAFFARKYPQMKYLAYFQSYSSTYGDGFRFGRELEEAMSVEDVVGIIVGTRPDCIDGDVIRALERVRERMPVFVELGVESMHDETLRLINRGHDSRVSESAIRTLADAGIHVGVHLIAGLPGETEEMALDTVRRICRMPVESIKLHHLQVLHGTPLERMVSEGKIEVRPFTLENYLEFCVKVVKTVPRGIAIERFLASAPPGTVAMPKWGMKNHEFIDRLHRRLTKVQGSTL